jgi:hypothetical protein
MERCTSERPTAWRSSVSCTKEVTHCCQLLAGCNNDQEERLVWTGRNLYQCVSANLSGTSPGAVNVRTLPCGYVKGVHEASVAGIPGLKNETPRHAGAGWGTLRVFPVILVAPYPALHSRFPREVPGYALVQVTSRPVTPSCHSFLVTPSCVTPSSEWN